MRENTGSPPKSNDPECHMKKGRTFTKHHFQPFNCPQSGFFFFFFWVRQKIHPTRYTPESIQGESLSKRDNSRYPNSANRKNFGRIANETGGNIGWTNDGVKKSHST